MTDLNSISDLLQERYPHTGITAEAVDGHAIASLTLPSDVSDLGSILATLRTDLCIVCDVRTVGGKFQLECWPAPRALPVRSSVRVMVIWATLLIIGVGITIWAVWGRKKY